MMIMMMTDILGYVDETDGQTDGRNEPTPRYIHLIIDMSTRYDRYTKRADR